MARFDRFSTPAADAETPTLPDIVCLSHLRWSFVFQRPQHIMSRLAAETRVFFVEEPEPLSPDEGHEPRLELREEEGAEGSVVTVAVPRLPPTQSESEAMALQGQLLDELMRRRGIVAPVLWYYTPMALPFTAHLRPSAVVFDCMDELSAFAGAPPELRAREAALLLHADLVTTGGRSLYEAKRDRNQNVHCFPSAVDVAHFSRARRRPGGDPADQALIPGPRLGYAGVIDERLDRELLAGVAAARPDWHLVMLGPVVKISAADLPVAPNIHYLGMKAYADLPAYMGGWDVAMLPFAANESTRYISPTKTPEYLAAGRPVVSTPIRDVVRTYGAAGLVHLADTVPAFVDAVEAALREDVIDLRRRADSFLEQSSWDATVAAMMRLVGEAVRESQRASIDDDGVSYEDGDDGAQAPAGDGRGTAPGSSRGHAAADPG